MGLFIHFQIRDALVYCPFVWMFVFACLFFIHFFCPNTTVNEWIKTLFGDLRYFSPYFYLFMLSLLIKKILNMKWICPFTSYAIASIHPKNFSFSFCLPTQQSKNWDGGGQERDTAVRCIREVFPESYITTKTTNTYPITVTITTETEDGKLVPVWSGSQKNLFRKRSAKRCKSIREIKKCLEGLQ